MLETQMMEFEKYFNKFNTSDDNILRKYNHSIRVMDFSIQIAKSLNQSNKMIEIIGLAGLLHDIGRFKQWTKYKTYYDLKSVNHAKLGVKILKKNDYIKNYITDEKYINYILKAVGQHNLYKIDEGQSLDEEIICKIIRDADKIDLLETQGNTLETNDIIHKETIDNIYKKKCCKTNIHDNEADHIISQICFIYDINFQYSLEYIINKGIIKNKLEIIKSHIPDGIDFSQIESNINQYLNRRLI